MSLSANSDQTAAQQKGILFDQLIGSHEQLVRHGEAESLGGFEIDHQVEFRRLLDRQVAWLCAFENLVDEGCSTMVEFGNVLAVAHQPAGAYSRCENMVAKRFASASS